MARSKLIRTATIVAKKAGKRMSLFGMNGLRGKSVKRILPSTEVAFMVGKNLTERLWLPDMEAETVDINASQLTQAVRQVSEALGTECKLMCIHMLTGKGKASHLVGIAKADALIGLYEVEDSKDGILMKRVCDHPVSELVRLELLPVDEGWPSRYDPVNRYGGNRKLPSRASAADLTAM